MKQAGRHAACWMIVAGTLLCLSSAAAVQLASRQGREETASLLLRFRETHDIEGKELILYRITQLGDGAGAQLLQLAKATHDVDTRWLAIRGLGMLKFRRAAPFLMQSLHSPERYVRSNAARALGELRYSPAAPALIHLLGVEQDAGVIEQTSLALGMLKAVDAVPALESRMSFHSTQTRCWLLDAIAELGSKNDIPFVAKHLYDTDPAVPLCAVSALTTLTGEDFGLPRQGGLSGVTDPPAPVVKARKWWEQAQDLKDVH
jgi:HEAT repeat protein